MSWGPLVCLLVAAGALSILPSPSHQERVAHRLIGGHLKIFHEDPQDADYLITSASSSKTSKDRNTNNSSKKPGKSEDEEKKTLAQQVADGKYGLIQKELFSRPQKRPGVLSYDVNPEVPKDTVKNLGGLTKNDIWLAENHLLVIKGGTYPQHEDNKADSNPTVIWPAIDDYKAPSRQVKIPAHPKIPPPFPVQLTDDGPLQILGTNFTRTLNGTFDEAAYPLLSPEIEIDGPPPGGEGQPPFFVPYPPGYPYSTNLTAGQTPFPVPAYPQQSPGPGQGKEGDYGVGSPFPPSLNGTFSPFFASLPPGAAILPPPGNQTDYLDEDDPSIYYPPPYSFYFPKDNSSAVPAGPLVPGIVLPPPPNFFGPLEENTTSTTTSRRTTTSTTTTTIPPCTTTTRKSTRIRTKTTTPVPQIYPTTPSVPPTSQVQQNNDKNKVVSPNKPAKVYGAHVVQNIPEINNELNPIVTTTVPPRIVTVISVTSSVGKNRTPSVLPTGVSRTQKPKRPPSVTILKPVKQPGTAVPPSNIYYYEPEERKPFKVYGPPSSQRINTVISTTQVPLKLYYSTPANQDIETNSIITQQPPPAEKFHIGTGRQPKTTVKPKAPAAVSDYFYYEEEPPPAITSTPKPGYYEYVPVNSRPSAPVLPQQQKQQPQQRPQFVYVTSRPTYQNSRRPSATPQFRFVQQPPKLDTFSLHIAKLQKQISHYYTTNRPTFRPVQHHSPKPVYQFSFEAANYRPAQQQQQNYYRQQHNNRPQQQSGIVDQQDPQDKFRPLPRYSVQIQPAVEITPTEHPPAGPAYYQQQQQRTPSSSERPQASRYYSTVRPDYEYEDYNGDRQNSPGGNNNLRNRYAQPQQYQSVTSPQPVSQYSFEARQTPSPIYQHQHQQFYTKPSSEDEQQGYFDDQNTKEYFTTFGQKIPSGTTPIPHQNQQSVRPQRPAYNQRARKPLTPGPEISLETDINVNYLPPRPPPNPESEFVPIARPRGNYQYQQQQQQTRLGAPGGINNAQQGPEIIKAVPVPPQGRGTTTTTAEGQPGSFISYQLPGDDGAHFYFLTPQLAQSREQGAGFYYTQNNNVPNGRVRRDGVVNKTTGKS